MRKITIGKSSEADLCYEGISVISGFHSEITVDSNTGRITYTDYSTNGSLVNGVKVHKASLNIKRGDVIQLPGDVIVDWEPYIFASSNVSVHGNETNHGVITVFEEDVPDSSSKSRKKLVTNRGLFKYICYSFLTLGIYPIVMYSKISTELNKVAKGDGKHTMHFCWIFFLLGPLTLGIMNFVWFHKLSNRIGAELRHRNISYSFNSGHFWGWNVVGSMIYVGPLIYIYELLHATNRLNDSYNRFG